VVPDQAVNLSAVGEPAYVDVSWQYFPSTPEKAAESFELQRKQSHEASWYQAAVVAGNTTTYQDATFDESGTYQYRVRATIGDENGPWSDIIELEVSSNTLDVLGNELVDVYGIYNYVNDPARKLVKCIRESDETTQDFSSSEIQDGTLVAWSQGQSVSIVEFFTQTDTGHTMTFTNAYTWQNVEGYAPRIITNGVMHTFEGRPAYKPMSDRRMAWTNDTYDHVWTTHFCGEAWYHRDWFMDEEIYIGGFESGSRWNNYTWKWSQMHETTLLVFNESKETWDFSVLAASVIRAIQGKPQLVFNSNTLYFPVLTGTVGLSINTVGVTPNAIMPNGDNVSATSIVYESRDWAADVENGIEDCHWMAVQVGDFDDIRSFKFTQVARYMNVTCLDQLHYLNDVTTMFEDARVSSMPINLLKNQANKASINSLQATFYKGTFRYVPTDFFEGLTAVTTINRLFSVSQFDRLENGLFDSFTAVTNADSAFNGNGYSTPLKYIEAGTFDNMTALENADYMFSRLPNLKRLEDRLFYNNSAINRTRYMFSECNNLEYVGAEVFNIDVNASDTYRTLGGQSASGVTLTLHEDALAACSRTENISGFFASNKNLETVPASLLSNCVSLRDASSLFDATSLSSIPSALFSNCIALEQLNYTFNSCKNITALPADLFANNTALVSAVATFSSCDNLTTVHPNLFGDSIVFPSLTTIRLLFQSCKSLTTVPETLFYGFGAVTDASYVFSSATNFNTIPTNLLIGMTAATNLKSMFSNTAVTSIPETLFSTNTNIRYFNNTFYSTPVSEVPENLFANNVNVESFNATFYNCSNLAAIHATAIGDKPSLTDAKYMFKKCTSLMSIPSGLFDQLSGNNISTVDLTQCFYGCTSLTTIPTDLFQVTGTGSLNVYETFKGCTSLTNATTFESNTRLRDASHLFYGCTSISSIPEGMFSGCINLRAASSCLRETAITELPERFMQNAGTNSSGVDISYICVNLTNFTSIPEDCFDGTLIKKSKYSFGNTSIATVPDLLFNYPSNTNSFDMSNMFKDCTSLVTVEGVISNDIAQYHDMKSIFDGCSALTTIATNALGSTTNYYVPLNYAFRNCVSLDPLPELWTQHTGTTYTDGCFEGCEGASNYSDVPESWR